MLLGPIGLLCLCVSMARHQADFFGRARSARWRIGIRRAGFALIAVSLAGACRIGPMAFLTWLGVMSLAALATVLCASAAARRARPPRPRRTADTG